MADEGGWAWSFAGAPPSESNDDAGQSAGGQRRDGRPEVKAGDVIAGRFELEALLGRGGAGAVWRAHETGTERGVALKLLESTLDAAQRARFEREGELTAALQHPGIVRVHAAGEHDGRPWIAYELVAGGTTAEHALRGLDRRGRLTLLRDAARAVGHAHARGIVHRDLKPQNILVDPHGRPRVADFGLARLHGAARLTGTGALVGTPLFMAPEQFSSKEHAVGPTTDVWALGVMLYEALTGAPPFQAPTLLALGARIVDGRPTPPRHRDPTISPALEAVVLAALAPEPADRPPDGEALAADLDAVLEGRTPRAARRRLSARGRRLALGGLLLAAAAAPLAVVTAASRTAPAPPRSERTPTTPAAELAAAEGLLRGAPNDPAAWRAATRARLALGQADVAARELERLTARAAWVERLRADVERARGLDPTPRLLRAAASWPDDPDLLEPLLERELALGRAREVAARLTALPLSLQADPRLSALGATVRALAAPDGAALRACGPALAELGARWLVRRARRDAALLARPPEPRPPSAIGPLGPAPERLPGTERAARARAALAAALAAAPDGRAAAQAWAVRADLEGPGAPGPRAGTTAADEAVARLSALAGPAPWLASALRAQARAALAAQRPIPGLAAATRALALLADELAAGAGAEGVEAGQAEAWTLCGEALLGLGRPDDAAAALERAGGAASLEPRTVATLASVRAVQGRGDEVAALEERAARLRGARRDEAEELVNRARHVMKREPTDQRLALYFEALALDPRNANARYQVGFLELRDQQFAVGFRAMVPAVRDAPWLRSREVVEAMEELGKIGRDVTGGRSPLGPLMAELGRAGSSRDRAVRGFVGHALAEYELQRGWVEPSLLDLRLHLDDDPSDVHALAILGFLELRAGRAGEAEDALDAALEAAPDVGTFHFYRGLVAAARGASSDVVGRHLQRAVALGHPALYDLRPYPELTARRSDVAAAQRAGLLLPGTAPPR